MATCAACKTFIIAGGVRDGDYRYCNAKCHRAGQVKQAQNYVPDELVEAEAAKLHASTCPKCKGPGPVDVHTVHTCMSFLVMTRWKSTPTVSCRSCATKSQLGALGTTLALGWWGFPWGLIYTPTQIIKNISGITNGPSPTAPSNDLKRLVLKMLAAQLAQQAGPVPPPLKQRGFEVIPTSDTNMLPE